METKWISINKRLPDSGKVVLAHVPDSIDDEKICKAIWYNEKDGGRDHWVVFENYGGSDRERVVTHWMELPNLPY